MVLNHSMFGFLFRLFPEANVEVVAPATGSASPNQGKGFSSGFNLRLAAGSGLSTHALFGLEVLDGELPGLPPLEIGLQGWSNP